MRPKIYDFSKLQNVGDGLEHEFLSKPNRIRVNNREHEFLSESNRIRVNNHAHEFLSGRNTITANGWQYEKCHN